MSIIASLLSEAINPILDDNQWSPMGGLFGAPGWYGNYATTSGEVVNERTALLVAAHFGCIRVVSEDIGKLPVKIAQEVGDDETNIRRDHPVHNILNVSFNPELNAARGLTLLIAHARGFKKGVAEIERDRRGEPVNLWPLDPTRVTKKRIDGRIMHEVRMDNGTSVMLPDEDVLEIIGPSYDGQIGYSIAEIGKFVLGTILAADKFQGSFFGNGAFLGGVIQNLPSAMSAEQIESLRRQFNERHQGSGNAFKTAVIPKGEFKEIGTDPRRAQLDQLKYASTIDICSIHRVSPTKLQVFKEAHYNNIEHLNIAHVSDALMPIGRDFELEVKRKMLPPDHYARLNYNALLRGDFESRQRGYAIGRMWGLYSLDEVRKLEDMNPVGGDEGSMRLIPANMIPINRANEPRDQQSTNAPPPREKQDQAALRESYMPMVLDGLTRAAQKEAKRVKFLQSKGRNGDVNAFYDEHKTYVASCVVPALRSLAMQVGALGINEDRLCVVTELFTSEWASAQPASAGPPDANWINSLAQRWIDAVCVAVSEE